MNLSNMDPLPKPKTRAMRASRGVCVDCEGLPLKTAHRCAECADKANARRKVYNVQRLAAGVCVACRGIPVVTGGRCAPCAETVRIGVRNNLRRKAGIPLDAPPQKRGPKPRPPAI